MSQLELLKQALTASKQEHLLMFYDHLTEDEKVQYIKDLQEVDFQEMVALFERANESYSKDVQLLDDHMQPIPKTQFGSEANSSPEQLNKYYQRGLQEISEGNVAVILMAGGQATRLGVNYPKGMYNVGLLSNKTLFQIQAERIIKVQKLANEAYKKNGKVTWYIMTSGPTISKTEQYLSENSYFGLNKEDVVIFQQGLLPCFDFNGKIFLDTKNKMVQAPDGNGGIYRALKVNGVLDDFEKRKIKYTHVHSVDNILIKVADPTFIGYCVEKNADCGAKVVQKATPTEAVGVVCLVDDRFQVVEYSEITDKTANLKNPDGTLTFNAGNICNHYFSVEFLNRVANQEMKVHVAKKKIPHCNEKGVLVKPTAPNGIKIEKFVFDVFQFSESFVTWEVPRDVEFSALKNSDDADKDCPTTARQDLYNLHKKYLQNVNADVSGDIFEISPAVSYGGEGLEQFQGKSLQAPMYIS